MNEQNKVYIEKLAPEYQLYSKIINMICRFIDSAEEMLLMYHLKATDSEEYITSIYSFISEAMLLYPVIKTFAQYLDYDPELIEFFEKYDPLFTTIEQDIYLNRGKYDIYFLRQMYYDFVYILSKIGLLSPYITRIPSKYSKMGKM